MIGVILAGGQSRRMGQDKAQLRHANGQTWLARNIELLEQLCDAVWISGRAGERGIADIYPHAGPAAAMVHCLEVLQDDVLFIPVDLPYLTLEALQGLMHQSADAVHYAAHPIPLWIKANANVKRRMQELHTPSDLSIHQLLMGLDVCQLPLGPSLETALTNANRPEDY